MSQLDIYKLGGGLRGSSSVSKSLVRRKRSVLDRLLIFHQILSFPNIICCGPALSPDITVPRFCHLGSIGGVSEFSDDSLNNLEQIGVLANPLLFAQKL